MKYTQFVADARSTRLWSMLIFFLSFFAWAVANAQITPLGDSYTNTSDPHTNYGAATLLDVNGATQITYIQFNLGSIPATASVSQATLKLYVNSVTAAGSFNVDYVSGAWSEAAIDASNAPPLGTAIASNVSVIAADKNQYILVDVTSAVQAWLSGSETNNGLALVANSSFNATFDSKENTTTSHPAELDVAFAGGDGTITGVETGSGSGLTGGGTSGTLNLSLTNGCAANQVLQWNGSAWACAAVGTGTITGVTAGTDLTGGGTSGNVTLNLNTSALNSTYAQLNAANSFTGNQTVNGGINAGAITATSSTSGGTGVLANAGSSTGSNGVIASGATGVASNATVSGGIALYGNSSGSGAYGVYADAGNGTGSNGVVGFGATGVAGNSTITGSYGTYGNGSYGVWGDTNGTGANIGVTGTAGAGGIGVDAYNSSTGDALFAYNQSGGYAAFFDGNVDVDGTLSKAGGSFKIDHPLDPANKYLYHSFVESPDMMNIYNGTVTTDAEGNATVQMPDWFEALNRDFRYQLTVIGQFSQAYVSSELANHEFSIKSDKPNVKISWQVTGVRQDAWANAHRIPVEVDKAEERGYYMHPELFGAPEERGIAAHRHPASMKPPTRPQFAQAHAPKR
jgi:hypothetical protein